MKMKNINHEQLKEEVREFMKDNDMSGRLEEMVTSVKGYILEFGWTYETPCSNCDNLRCSKESKKYDIIRNKIFYCPDQR